jgi:hypothetical protein
MEKNIFFRSVINEDFEQLKSLHELLFPVRYADSFYSEICSSAKDRPPREFSDEFCRINR